MSNILVIGANGGLGRAVLEAVGPRNGIAVTRRKWPEGSPFRHVALQPDGSLPVETLADTTAIVNAAGRVDAGEAELTEANVDLPVRLAKQARAAGLTRFVQVSSFSVYGLAETIGVETPLRPITPYGRSKSCGDRKLLELQAAQFAVECVRLPFLFSVDKPALVGSLVAAALKLPAWPVAATPVERSMITYGDAGAVLAAVAGRSGDGGISHAADPQLFTFPLLARLLAEETGRRLRLVRVPAPLQALLRRTVPSLHRRLFQSSVLDPEANLAMQIELPLGLDPAMRLIIRQRRHKPVDTA